MIKKNISGLSQLQKMPLPPMRIGMLAMIGPAFILASFAQGSGELIWWPYLSAKYGLAFIGLLLPACLIQYFVNAEVIRYTALTGEGIWAGFRRLGGWYSIPLFTLAFLSLLWFGGYASAGGTALYELTHFPPGVSPRAGSLFWGYVTITLLSFGMFKSSNVYHLLEIFMKGIVAITVIGLVISLLQPQVLSTADDFFAAFFNPLSVTYPDNWDPADASVLITALAFAGLGGFFNLMYSYWMKDKGVGMAHYAHKVQTRSSSERDNQFPVTNGVYFEDNEENRKNWVSWRKYLHYDNFFGILINVFTVMITTWLAFSLLSPKGIFPDGWEIVVVQSEFFSQWLGNTGKVIFLIVAAAFLGDTWFAAADGTSRMFADFTRSHVPQAKSKSFSYWYYFWLVFLIVVTCITMPLAKPGILIQVGGVVSIFAFVLFIPVLFYLNYRLLPQKFPRWIIPPLWRAIMLWIVWGIYLTIAIWYLTIVF
ncbi:MAG: Nramp family divalent metal transporter [Nitrosomonadaceae bacterium]